jgi:hypothetical protein
MNIKTHCYFVTPKYCVLLLLLLWRLRMPPRTLSVIYIYIYIYSSLALCFVFRRVRLLQVLKASRAVPGLLLEHRVGTIRCWRLRAVLASCGCVGRGSKYPSFRVWLPVGFRLGSDYVVRHHVRNVMIIRVLVIRWGVCSSPVSII